MKSITTFDSTKESLLDLLRRIKEARDQLPDFQRGWVWDDDHIKSLLASISLSFPIGALMFMQIGNEDVRFKPRLIEGAQISMPPEPERLILDGQQRLTSLFQALYIDGAVSTRDIRRRPIKRWYYIDINKALDINADREEAIISLSEDKLIKNFQGKVIEDYSSLDSEYKALLFPLNKVLDSANWRSGFYQAWGFDSEKIKIFDQFEREVIKRFEQYQVPVIVLNKETPKEAVCQVFEKVNTGGVSLTVFELLTATYAADDFNLRDDWAARHTIFKNYPLLASLENTDFLQSVTLLASMERKETFPEAAVTCKRKDILRLKLEEYKKWADWATRGFEKAVKILHTQYIFDARDLPYKTQLVPLATILATLGDKADMDGVRSKLSHWYWCGVLGELYGSAIETRFAKDVMEVLDWINGSNKPSTVSEAIFSHQRLLTLRTRNSAAYKGIFALLLRNGALDIRTGDPVNIQLYFDERIDIHHIFPRDYCQKQGLDNKKCDSIVNKTPLSAKTNRMIGSNPPSTYLQRLKKQAEIPHERMGEILSSHLISAKDLESNDFHAFFEARKQALLYQIETAMGKKTLEDRTEINADIGDDYEDEE